MTINPNILVGDCRDSLRSLPEKMFNTCVTSPPYFGLRDYGVDGQIGLEETPEDFIAEMVSVFREVHRVLRDDGVLWLNLGDSYYNYRPGKGQALVKQSVSSTKQDLPEVCARRGNKLEGLKEKDLIGIPWRVALALQADGWYLRQDIVWSKPNPMPESVKDRCTRSHEYIFMLTKSPRYYYDSEAIKEPAVTKDKRSRTAVTKDKRSRTAGGSDKQRGHGPRHAGFNGRYAEKIEKDGVPETRNRRSVWNVATRPFKGSHFATFPPDLIEPCVLAGSPVGGWVLDPFLGSGTTAVVAERHNRFWVGCELNADYAQLATQRIEGGK